MSLAILQSNSHPRLRVDPFGQLPCKHRRVMVHITNGEGLADDLVECALCGYAVTFRDLYAPVRLPTGMLPTS